MEKRTTDSILDALKTMVESKINISQDKWIDAAFFLNVLQPDEVHTLEMMKQGIAQKKLAILKAQEKRNVAAVELEIEASDDYRLMREQENKVERIEETIRLAKKASDRAY